MPFTLEALRMLCPWVTDDDIDLDFYMKYDVLPRPPPGAKVFPKPASEASSDGGARFLDEPPAEPTAHDVLLALRAATAAAEGQAVLAVLCANLGEMLCEGKKLTFDSRYTANAAGPSWDACCRCSGGASAAKSFKPKFALAGLTPPEKMVTGKGESHGDFNLGIFACNFSAATDALALMEPGSALEAIQDARISLTCPAISSTPMQRVAGALALGELSINGARYGRLDELRGLLRDKPRMDMWQKKWRGDLTGLDVASILEDARQNRSSLTLGAEASATRPPVTGAAANFGKVLSRSQSPPAALMSFGVLDSATGTHSQSQTQTQTQSQSQTQTQTPPRGLFSFGGPGGAAGTSTHMQSQSQSPPRELFSFGGPGGAAGTSTRAQSQSQSPPRVPLSFGGLGGAAGPHSLPQSLLGGLSANRAPLCGLGGAAEPRSHSPLGGLDATPAATIERAQPPLPQLQLPPVQSGQENVAGQLQWRGRGPLIQKRPLAQRATRTNCSTCGIRLQPGRLSLSQKDGLCKSCRGAVDT